MFKRFIILHSELDGASRFFVAGNFSPDNPDVQVLDWNNPDQRSEYEAAGLPSPSAFPAVVNTENDEIINVPKSLDDAIAVLTGQPTVQEKVDLLSQQLAAAQEQIELLNQTVETLLAGG
jgi:hypothetical protein